MINCKLTKEEKEKQNEIVRYLKNNRKKVFKSKDFDRRDRIAMISLMFGKFGFKLCWNIYDRIKN